MEKRNTLIVTGGSLNSDFAKSLIEEESFKFIIGVDGGLDFLYRNGIAPTHIVGDFDTVTQEALRYYKSLPGIEIQEFRPEKDATDTQISIELAVRLNSTQITIIGAMGSRLDHVLGNIYSMAIALKCKIPCYLQDENNKVFLLQDDLTIKKNEQYGAYISLLPLTTEVAGVTLEGFKYPLFNDTLSSFDSLGISNEIVEETASIAFNDGILIMVQSKDQ
jgi:thiamine pyrophosphokinase